MKNSWIGLLVLYLMMFLCSSFLIKGQVGLYFIWAGITSYIVTGIILDTLKIWRK